MSPKPVGLAGLVSIRSRQAELVMAFLRRVSQQGLTIHVPVRPSQLSGADILDFCVPVHVSDEQALMRARNGRVPLQRSGTLDRPELLSAAEHSHNTGQAPPSVRTLDQALRSRRRITVRGDPGDGKTVAVWLHVARTCGEFANRIEQRRTQVYDPSFSLPLALPLDELLTTNLRGKSLSDVARQYLLGLCYGLSDVPPSVARWLDEKIGRREFQFCLDGLDELTAREHTAPVNKRRSASEWLRGQLSHFIDVPILMTTRPMEDERFLELSAHYRIVTPGAHQVRDFIDRYFQNEAGGEELAADLKKQLRSTGAMPLARIPLHLSILCGLKTADPAVPLPLSRTLLLKRCLLAMMERGEAGQKNNYNKRTGRNLKKLTELYYVARRFATGVRMQEETDLVAFLGTRSLRASNLPEVDDLLAEFRRDGILARHGDGTDRFVLRSFFEFCLAGSIAMNDPIEARRLFEGMVLLEARDDAGFRVLDPAWRQVWPLVAGHNSAHCDWLVSAIWPAGWEAAPREHVMLAAEVIHESGAAGSSPSSQTREIVDWLREAAAVHPAAAAALGHLGGELSRNTLSDALAADGPEELKQECARTMARIGDERCCRTLRKALQDLHTPDSVCAECAWALGRIGGKASIAVLARMLNRQRLPEWVRRVCAAALGEAGGDTSRRALDEMLHSRRTPLWVRCGCAQALGHVGGDASAFTLAAILRQRRMHHSILVECAAALGRIGGDTSRTALENALLCADLPPVIRAACATALAQFGTDQSRQLIDELLGGRDIDQKIRVACAESLTELDGERSLSTLFAVLNDESEPEMLRSRCAAALGLIGTGQSRRLLQDILKANATPEIVRLSCAEGLGLLGGEASAEFLTKMMQCRELSTTVRSTCALSLGRTGSELAREALAKALQAKNSPAEVRAGVVRALGLCGDDTIAPLLRDLIARPRAAPLVRAACASVLAKIGGESSRRALIAALLKSQHPQVRQACAKALGRFSTEDARRALTVASRGADATQQTRSECLVALRAMRHRQLTQALLGRLHLPRATDPSRGPRSR